MKSSDERNEAEAGVDAAVNELVHAVMRHSFRTAWASMKLVAPFAAIFAAADLGEKWAPDRAGQEYFAASAQVIPVLLLALAVESHLLGAKRIFRRGPQFVPPAKTSAALRVLAVDAPRLVRALRVGGKASLALLRYQPPLAGLLWTGYLLYLMINAEWQCLSTLATLSDDELREPSEVSGGILAGLVGTAAIALIGRKDEAPSDDGTRSTQ